MKTTFINSVEVQNVQVNLYFTTTDRERFNVFKLFEGGLKIQNINNREHTATTLLTEVIYLKL